MDYIFSAWILLGHIRERHRVFLEFMKNPDQISETWPAAFWPENYQPKTEEEWDQAITAYEIDLQEMIDLIANPETDLFKKHKEGETISRVAMAVLHHTRYHIGQLRTIGR